MGNMKIGEWSINKLVYLHRLLRQSLPEAGKSPDVDSSIKVQSPATIILPY